MPEEKPKILVVDDDSQITRVLKTTLSAQGYEIRTAADGMEALKVISEWPPALLITDLRMPNMDGVELCRHLRPKSVLPIIVLSVRGDEGTKVAALDAGADDYITKPFGAKELLARIRAALRRSVVTTNREAHKIEVGDFRIDLESRSIGVKGREIKLTPKEFDLLTYFAQRPGKIVTHRALLANIWGEESTENPQYLHVFVGHLRKKLQPDEGSPRYITTEPWVGYRFNPTGE
jgi:two-component system, OmpR family, KDP operon response regulator KdpE